MTVPNSTPIYFSNIAAEFGKYGDPYYLSQYYAGGGLVPAGCVGANGAIPSSGTISLWNFMGATRSQTFSLGIGHRVIGTNTHLYGYSIQWGVGSIAPNTMACMGNATITDLWYYLNSGGISMIVQGVHPRNSFTTININGTVYNQADAYFYDGGGNSEWDWSTGNALGQSGTITVVVT